jgi:hypothetical protein
MANQQLCPPELGFIDSRRATSVYNSGASAAATAIVAYSETASIATLRTALNTHSPIGYTSAVLDGMTVNDMVFAWRMCSGNHASVSDYAIAQVAH